MPPLLHAALEVEPVLCGAEHSHRAIRVGRGLERRIVVELAPVGLPGALGRGADEVGTLLAASFPSLLCVSLSVRFTLLGPSPLGG